MNLSAVGSVIVGGLLALWVFAGRSALERLGMDGVEGAPGELRFWLVLGMALGAMLTVIVSLASRRRTLPTRGLGFVAFTTLVLLLWLLTGIQSPADSRMEKAYDLLLMLGVLWIVSSVVLSHDDPHVLHGFLATLAALSALFALIGLTAVVRGDVGGRLAVLGGGPNVFARLVAFVGVWAAFPRGRVPQPLRALIIAISGLLVLLSGSRGGLLAYLAALLWAIAFQPLRRVVIQGVVIGVGLGGLLAGTQVGKAAATAFQSRVLQLTFDERYSSGRGEIYQLASDYIVRSPWLGHGLDAFRETGWQYPHNVVVEAAIEGGVLLALLVVILFAYLLVVGARRRLDPDMQLLCCWSVLIIVASMFSGDVYDARLLFVMPAFMIPAAVRPGSPRPRWTR